MATFENRWTPANFLQIGGFIVVIVGGWYTLSGKVEATSREVDRVEVRLEKVQGETVANDKRLTRIEDKLDYLVERLTPARPAP
jgi:hypothetical protein